MKFKISFANDSIILELLEFSSFSSRTIIIKWNALSDTYYENQESIRWGKPYENEKIDIPLRNSILYHLCCELSKLNYNGYRGEYVGDKLKFEIDKIISLGENYV
jgi:hypothetical protein